MRRVREPIYGLDIIRFVAALSVMVYHFAFKAWATDQNQLLTLIGRAPALPGWWPVSWWGWIGVQIFFVISGMVISYSSENVGAGEFARRRILRLVPSAWVCALLALPVALAAFHVSPHDALSGFFRVALFLPSGPWLMGQFWTLPIEYCFYFVVFGLIASGRAQQLELLAWILALASGLFYLLTHELGFHDPNGRLSALLLLQHGGLFALGIILTRGDVHGWRVRYLVLAGLCLLLGAFQIKDAAVGEKLIGGLAQSWPIPFAIWLLFVGLIAASLHWKETIAHFGRRHDALLRYIGLLTYPLYLIHIHAGGPILVTLLQRGYAPIVAFIAASGTAVIVALVVTLWLEPPVRRLLGTMLDPVMFTRLRRGPTNG